MGYSIKVSCRIEDLIITDNCRVLKSKRIELKGSLAVY